MPVSFERIPSNIRVPLFYAEVSNREAAYLQLLQPALIIGPMLESGRATPLEPILVTDAQQGYGLFGAGSILADMIASYRRNDNFGTVWAIPHADPQNSTAASFTDRVSGVAAGSGTLGLYVAGERYAVTIRAGNDGAAVAQRIVETVNADPFAVVVASTNGEAAPVAPEPSLSSLQPNSMQRSPAGAAAGGRTATPRRGAARAGSAVVTYTAKNRGAIGNEIGRTLNFRGVAGGEATPPGIQIEGLNPEGRFEGGAGLAELAPVIAAMGDEEYDFICNPYTDSTSLDLLAEEMNDVTGRWAWSRQIYGHVFAAKMGDVQSLVAFGHTRNDPHASVLGFAQSPTVSWRRAAALCAQAAGSLRNDPPRPLQTLPLVGVLAPKRGDRFRLGDSNTLLYSGVATEMESGGAAAIQRCVTTYRVNQWNQPDPSWLDVQTPATLTYIIRFLRNRILQKFPRHKLADDGTPFGLGQAIVTPRIIRAELVAAYSELISMGIVENMDAFKQFLIVERDPVDPNRVNVLLPPDLVNQLRIFAMLVEFRLQYSPTALLAA
jgi:phage tail sheath gpL-like